MAAGGGWGYTTSYSSYYRDEDRKKLKAAGKRFEEGMLWLVTEERSAPDEVRKESRYLFDSWEDRVKDYGLIRTGGSSSWSQREPDEGFFPVLLQATAACRRAAQEASLGCDPGLRELHKAEQEEEQAKARAKAAPKPAPKLTPARFGLAQQLGQQPGGAPAPPAGSFWARLRGQTQPQPPAPATGAPTPPPPPAAAGGAVWSCDLHGGGQFNPYEATDSAQIEAAYQQAMQQTGPSAVSIALSFNPGQPYLFNFHEMVQINASTGNARSIRRGPTDDTPRAPPPPEGMGQPAELAALEARRAMEQQAAMQRLQSRRERMMAELAAERSRLESSGAQDSAAAERRERMEMLLERMEREREEQEALGAHHHHHHGSGLFGGMPGFGGGGFGGGGFPGGFGGAAMQLSPEEEQAAETLPGPPEKAEVRPLALRALLCAYAGYRVIHALIPDARDIPSEMEEASRKLGTELMLLQSDCVTAATKMGPLKIPQTGWASFQPLRAQGYTSQSGWSSYAYTHWEGVVQKATKDLLARVPFGRKGSAAAALLATVRANLEGHREPQPQWANILQKMCADERDIPRAAEFLLWHSRRPVPEKSMLPLPLDERLFQQLLRKIAKAVPSEACWALLADKDGTLRQQQEEEHQAQRLEGHELVGRWCLNGEAYLGRDFRISRQDGQLMYTERTGGQTAETLVGHLVTLREAGLHPPQGFNARWVGHLQAEGRDGPGRMMYVRIVSPYMLETLHEEDPAAPGYGSRRFATRDASQQDSTIAFCFRLLNTTLLGRPTPDLRNKLGRLFGSMPHLAHGMLGFWENNTTTLQRCHPRSLVLALEHVPGGRQQHVVGATGFLRRISGKITSPNLVSIAGHLLTLGWPLQPDDALHVIREASLAYGSVSKDPVSVLYLMSALPRGDFDGVWDWIGGYKDGELKACFEVSGHSVRCLNSALAGTTVSHVRYSDRALHFRLAVPTAAGRAGVAAVTGNDAELAADQILHVGDRVRVRDHATGMGCEWKLGIVTEVNETDPGRSKVRCDTHQTAFTWNYIEKVIAPPPAATASSGTTTTTGDWTTNVFVSMRYPGVECSGSWRTSYGSDSECLFRRPAPPPGPEEDDGFGNTDAWTPPAAGKVSKAMLAWMRKWEWKEHRGTGARPGDNAAAFVRQCINGDVWKKDSLFPSLWEGVVSKIVTESFRFTSELDAWVLGGSDAVAEVSSEDIEPAYRYPGLESLALEDRLAAGGILLGIYMKHRPIGVDAWDRPPVPIERARLVGERFQGVVEGAETLAKRTVEAAEVLQHRIDSQEISRAQIVELQRHRAVLEANGTRINSQELLDRIAGALRGVENTGAMLSELVRRWGVGGASVLLERLESCLRERDFTPLATIESINREVRERLGGVLQHQDAATSPLLRAHFRRCVSTRPRAEPGVLPFVFQSAHPLYEAYQKLREWCTKEADGGQLAVLVEDLAGRHSVPATRFLLAYAAQRTFLARGTSHPAASRIASDAALAKKLGLCQEAQRVLRMCLDSRDLQRESAEAVGELLQDGEGGSGKVMHAAIAVAFALPESHLAGLLYRAKRLGGKFLPGLSTGSPAGKSCLFDQTANVDEDGKPVVSKQKYPPGSGVCEIWGVSYGLTAVQLLLFEDSIDFFKSQFYSDAMFKKLPRKRRQTPQQVGSTRAAQYSACILNAIHQRMGKDVPAADGVRAATSALLELHSSTLFGVKGEGEGGKDPTLVCARVPQRRAEAADVERLYESHHGRKPQEPPPEPEAACMVTEFPSTFEATLERVRGLSLDDPLEEAVAGLDPVEGDYHEGRRGQERHLLKALGCSDEVVSALLDAALPLRCAVHHLRHFRKLWRNPPSAGLKLRADFFTESDEKRLLLELDADAIRLKAAGETMQELRQCSHGCQPRVLRLIGAMSHCGNLVDFVRLHPEAQGPELAQVLANAKDKQHADFQTFLECCAYVNPFVQASEAHSKLLKEREAAASAEDDDEADIGAALRDPLQCSGFFRELSKAFGKEEDAANMDLLEEMLLTTSERDKLEALKELVASKTSTVEALIAQVCRFLHSSVEVILPATGTPSMFVEAAGEKQDAQRVSLSLSQYKDLVFRSKLQEGVDPSLSLFVKQAKEVIRAFMAASAIFREGHIEFRGRRLQFAHDDARRVHGRLKALRGQWVLTALGAADSGGDTGSAVLVEAVREQPLLGALSSAELVRLALLLRETAPPGERERQWGAAELLKPLRAGRRLRPLRTDPAWREAVNQMGPPTDAFPHSPGPDAKPPIGLPSARSARSAWSRTHHSIDKAESGMLAIRREAQHRYPSLALGEWVMGGGKHRWDCTIVSGPVQSLMIGVASPGVDLAGGDASYGSMWVMHSDGRTLAHGKPQGRGREGFRVGSTVGVLFDAD
eukprot:Hpha_TRINITY_DN15790_c2_g4::TRINITY_DN15790_c2_g4_i1::g.38457::m.38457